MRSPTGDPDPDSIAERLKQQFGDDIGPTLPLDPEPAPDKDAPSTLFDKLRGAGTRGSRYRLLGEVARGGMGVVLKIWDDELRRTLAMKVVLGRGDESKGDTPHVDPKTLGRFLEEAQVTGQLDHPGIVPVHELGLGADGHVYFTMRLVKGEDLRTIFEKVRTGEDGWNQVRALGVMLKVCEAMSYAHSKKVVHRDLKPANVMVGKFGEVYVMDWGLARVLGREDKHDLRIKPQPTTQSAVRTERRERRDETPDSPLVTMDGDIVGTPSFMPPEQAKGQLDKLGPHSDVYALGAMLYQLITGEMPYVPTGARVSVYTILSAVLHGPPAEIESLAPKTPPELVAICEKAMSRSIPLRYLDMRAFASDLRAYLEGRVVRAHERGTWAESRKWVRRNKPLATALAAAVLAIAIGGGAFAVKAKEATDTRDGLARKNLELESSNSALEKAKSDALASAQTATFNEEVAEAARSEAQRAQESAERMANDVLALSAQMDLDDLVARAEKLWPAYPEMIPQYQAWLTEAHELIEGRTADPAKGLGKRPSLEEHKAMLAQLRTKLLPLRLEQAKAEVTWQSRMLGLEPWPSESEVEMQLASESLPSGASELNSLAWSLVDPSKPVRGKEVRALLLARRAVAAAGERVGAFERDTLAWAMFRLGRLDEALAEERSALAEPRVGLEDMVAESARKLENDVSSWRDSELPKRRIEHEALILRVSNLERKVSDGLNYDHLELGWWDVQLSKLVAGLESLRDPKTGLMSDTLSESFGWGLTKRYEFARQIVERSVEGAEANKLWADAIAAVKASPKYSGLELRPQMGLLPIGMDSASGLWEFAHLQTGEPAVRGADGKLILTEETGLVFVLIPGGTFWMGAQRTDESGQNFDPQADDAESPVHEVALSAYFMSKYEMTQGQWLRFVGRNPSIYHPGAKFGDKARSLLNPVEQVSWNTSMGVLNWLGLALPTEAQWEYAARAGTHSAWWTGAEKEAIGGAANLADAFYKSNGGPTAWVYEDWLDDGWAAHARVGSYRANAFGLHDVIGNVAEWCRDGFGGYDLPTQAGDGERRVPGASDRVRRGGSFYFAASFARSAARYEYAPEYQYDRLGLRPARAIAP